MSRRTRHHQYPTRRGGRPCPPARKALLVTLCRGDPRGRPPAMHHTPWKPCHYEAGAHTGCGNPLPVPSPPLPKGGWHGEAVTEGSPPSTPCNEKRPEAANAPPGPFPLSYSPPIPVHRALLILLAVIGIASVLHLRIIGGKVLPTQLADIFVAPVATKEPLALIIQIITPCHFDSFLSKSSVWLKSQNKNHLIRFNFMVYTIAPSQNLIDCFRQCFALIYGFCT